MQILIIRTLPSSRLLSCGRALHLPCNPIRSYETLPNADQSAQEKQTGNNERVLLTIKLTWSLIVWCRCEIVPLIVYMERLIKVPLFLHKCRTENDSQRQSLIFV